MYNPCTGKCCLTMHHGSVPGSDGGIYPKAPLTSSGNRVYKSRIAPHQIQQKRFAGNSVCRFLPNLQLLQFPHPVPPWQHKYRNELPDHRPARCRRHTRLLGNPSLVPVKLRSFLRASSRVSWPSSSRCSARPLTLNVKSMAVPQTETFCTQQVIACFSILGATIERYFFEALTSSMGSICFSNMSPASSSKPSLIFSPFNKFSIS